MRPSNYDLQAQAAGRSFAAQDLDAIAARFALRRDETYLYLELLYEPLRLSRADGAAERQHDGVWMPAPFGAAMTAYTGRKVFLGLVSGDDDLGAKTNSC